MNHPHHHDKQLPERYHPFQTTHRNTEDQPSAQRFSGLARLLYRIQRIHFFTFLLVVILGWSLYQVILRSSSPSYTIPKQWVHRIEHIVHTLFVPNPQKVSNLNQLSTKKPKPPQNKQVKEALQPPELEHPKTLELEQRLKDTQAHSEKLQQAFEALQTQFIEATQQLQQIYQVVTEHTQRLTEIAQSERPPHPPTTEPDTQPTSEVPEPEPALQITYSVHAAIPGRAWLNTQDGKILTVNSGSEVPYGGTVQAIDSEQKLVYFDTGQVIGPAVGDS